MSALFVILVSLMMLLFSQKVLISNRCISGLMSNLIKKSWTDSNPACSLQHFEIFIHLPCFTFISLYYLDYISFLDFFFPFIAFFYLNFLFPFSISRSNLYTSKKNPQYINGMVNKLLAFLFLPGWSEPEIKCTLHVA